MAIYVISHRIFDDTGSHIFVGNKNPIDIQNTRGKDYEVNSRAFMALAEDYANRGYRLKEEDVFTTIPAIVRVVGKFIELPFDGLVLREFEDIFLRVCRRRK